MPSGPNTLDANGILRPGEDGVSFSPVSDWLDAFIESISDAIGDDRSRFDAEVPILQQGELTTGSYASAGNSGTTVYWGTVTITFPTAFSVPPTVVIECRTTGAVAVCNVLAVTTTQVTFRVMRFAAVLGTLVFGWKAVGPR